MIDIELFLGLPLDPPLMEALQGADRSLVALFLRSDEREYLQQVVHEDVVYLGKFVGFESDLQNLKLLEAHIFSMIRKILPDSPLAASLILFPIFH